MRVDRIQTQLEQQERPAAPRCSRGKTRRRRVGEKQPGRRRGFKPSAPLAILMSRAVRISAMRVELKWTELSSATGRSMRSSLCGRQRIGGEGRQ